MEEGSFSSAIQNTGGTVHISDAYLTASGSMDAERNIICLLSLRVVLTMAFTISRFILSSILSASSTTMVFTVWAGIFFLPIKSYILPAEPIIIWGFSLSLSSWRCIPAFPIISADLTSIPEFAARSSAWRCTCTASSWVGVRIIHWAERREVSIFIKIGNKYVRVFPEPVSALAITLFLARMSGTVFS